MTSQPEFEALLVFSVVSGELDGMVVIHKSGD